MAAGGPPSSPSGRVPQWVVDEAAGRASEVEPWRAWSPPPHPRPRRARRWWRAVLTVTVVGVVCSTALATREGWIPAPPGAPAAAAGSGEPGFPHPTPGVGASDGPLGVPAAAPAGGGPFAFSALQADGTTPVAYDPCRAVHVVVRPDNAPPGGAELIGEALARASQATGLQFVVDGATEEAPGPERAPYQPDRYGDRWAPVLVSWATVAEEPELAGNVAGLGGSVSAGLPGQPQVYVTGIVALDAVDLAGLMAQPEGTAAARGIVLHELGHLVGLAHVDDPTQLMNPVDSTLHDYAGGDLAGLARLGAGACVPQL